ncbi:MAG: shikimate dehydrogenase [Pseudomonadota bacterium]|nr:shikimate dehydrogenase [Pseudomonadota bacterium]
MTPIDRYAVLGHPVEHSRSPFIHAEFARLTGQAIDYGRRLCPLQGFELALRAFAAEGARGCNVTVPFKFDALRLASQASPRAALAGAANTLRFDTEGFGADNTDGVGLVRDIETGAGIALAGRRLLLVGAGGAAAGVLGPLIAAGPACIVVANRSPDKAAALVARHRDHATAHAVALFHAALDRADKSEGASRFDVVINASASSLHGAPPPVTAAVLAPGALALDLMYGAAAEPFMAWARQAGATARDGLGMLVEQAAESFAIWRGVHPPTAPVLAALRAQDANREHP